MVRCNDGTDDINHIFCPCKFINKFWSDFNDCFNGKVDIKMTKRNVFLGLDDELLCTLLFAGKHLIHRSHFQEIVPTFRVFLEKVFYIQKMEKETCKKNSRFERWYNKWCPLL